MGGFTDALNRFAKKVDENLDLVVRKVTFEIASDLIRMSPVDTGRFRANWMIGSGNPNLTVTESSDKSGAVSLGRVQGGLAQISADHAVYLTNSLPYAQRLEYGYSTQAPGGMVRITVARFERHISVAAQGLK